MQDPNPPIEPEDTLDVYEGEDTIIYYDLNEEQHVVIKNPNDD